MQRTFQICTIVLASVLLAGCAPDASSESEAPDPNEPAIFQWTASKKAICIVWYPPERIYYPCSDVPPLALRDYHRYVGPPELIPGFPPFEP